MYGRILLAYTKEFCDPAGETINPHRYNFLVECYPFGAGILFARYMEEMSRLTYAAIILKCPYSLYVFRF